MCGRTACTLAPSNIQRALQYKDANGESRLPCWRDASCGGEYRPSANLPPTSFSPVLRRGRGSPSGEAGASPTESSNTDELTRIVQPMLWGFIPPWFDGENVKNTGLSTNNARLEKIESSKLYSSQLTKRCLVVCDGFYEWKRDGAVKQPYFIYASQEGKKIEDVLEFAKDPDGDLNKGPWTGPKLLLMAGLWSVFKDRRNCKDVANFTILTTEANSVFSWLHHRVPCFVREEDVDAWLDPSTPIKQALGLLQPLREGVLAWHPVSAEVGNVRNQEHSLIKPAPLIPNNSKNATSKASVNLMSNWLNKRPAAQGGADTKKRKD